METALILPHFDRLTHEEARRRAKKVADILRGLSKTGIVFSFELHKRGDEIFLTLSSDSEESLEKLVALLRQAYPESKFEVRKGAVRIPRDFSVYRIDVRDWREPLPKVHDTSMGRPELVRELVELLSTMNGDFTVQVVCKAVGDWRGKVEGYYIKWLRRDRVTLDDRLDPLYSSMAREALERASEGGYNVTVRVGGSTNEGAKMLAEYIAGLSRANMLVKRDGVKALTSRELKGNMRMSASELANLINLPYGAVEKVLSSFVPPVEPPLAALRRMYNTGAPIVEVNGVTVRLDREELLRHMLITGTSGCGKTTYISYLITSIYKHLGGIFIVLSPKKGEAKNIVGYLRAVFGEKWLRDHVIVFDFVHSYLKYNLFRVPEEFFTDPAVRKRTINNAEAQIFNFFYESRGQRLSEVAPNVRMLLKVSVQYLFKDKIDMNSRDVDQITLHDLLKVIRFMADKVVPPDASPEVKMIMEQLAGRIQSSTLMALYNRMVDFLILDELRAMTSYRGPDIFDLPKMAAKSKPLVLIFDVGEYEGFERKRLMTIALTLLLVKAILSRPEPDPPIWFFVDEFREVADVNIYKWILAEARSLGMGLFLGLQFPKQISKGDLLMEVLENTNTTVFFKTKISPNLDAFKRGSVDYNKYIPELPLYHAFFMLGTGSEVVVPFIAKTPPPPPSHEMSQEEYLRFVKEQADRFNLHLERMPSLFEEVGRFTLEEDIADLLKDGRARSLGEITNVMRKRGWSVDEMTVLNAIEKLGGRIERVRTKSGAYLYRSSSPAPSGGATIKGGGERHRDLVSKAYDYLVRRGYRVFYPKQAEFEAQPDLIALSPTGDKIAVEVEATLKHPDQVRKNLAKNRKLGYRVMFVVPPELEGRLITILGDKRSECEVVSLG